MLKRVWLFRGDSGIAWPEEGLNAERKLIIVSCNQHKLIGRSVAHDRGKEVIGQSKLLRPSPESGHRSGVIVAHGIGAVGERELVHLSLIPGVHEWAAGMGEIRCGEVGQHE